MTSNWQTTNSFVSQVDYYLSTTTNWNPNNRPSFYIWDTNTSSKAYEVNLTTSTGWQTAILSGNLTLDHQYWLVADFKEWVNMPSVNIGFDAMRLGTLESETGTNWTFPALIRCKNILINNTLNSYNSKNYTVFVTLSNTTGIDTSKYDIRFSSGSCGSGGVQLGSYRINSTYQAVFVNDSIGIPSSSTRNISMYYGNTSAISDISSIKEAYIFGEDWNGYTSTNSIYSYYFNNSDMVNSNCKITLRGTTDKYYEANVTPISSPTNATRGYIWGCGIHTNNNYILINTTMEGYIKRQTAGSGGDDIAIGMFAGSNLTSSDTNIMLEHNDASGYELYNCFNGKDDWVTYSCTANTSIGNILASSFTPFKFIWNVTGQFGNYNNGQALSYDTAHKGLVNPLTPMTLLWEVATPSASSDPTSIAWDNLTVRTIANPEPTTSIIEQEFEFSGITPTPITAIQNNGCSYSSGTSYYYPYYLTSLPTAIQDHIGDWNDVSIIWAWDGWTWLYYAPDNPPYSTLYSITKDQIFNVYTKSGNNYTLGDPTSTFGTFCRSILDSPARTGFKTNFTGCGNNTAIYGNCPSGTRCQVWTSTFIYGQTFDYAYILGDTNTIACHNISLSTYNYDLCVDAYGNFVNCVGGNNTIPIPPSQQPPSSTSLLGSIALWVGSAFGITDTASSYNIFSLLTSLLGSIGAVFLVIFKGKGMDGKGTVTLFFGTFIVGLILFSIANFLSAWVTIVLIAGIGAMLFYMLKGG